MIKMITAIATAGLLLIAAPALADRDDRHKYRGVPKTQQMGGSALRKAYNREQHRSTRAKRRDKGKHQPRQRAGRDRGANRSRDRNHNRDKNRSRDRAHNRDKNHSRDRNRNRGGNKRARDRKRDNFWDHDTYTKRVKRDRRDWKRGDRRDWKRGDRRDWKRGDRRRKAGHRDAGRRYSWVRKHKPRRPVYRRGYAKHRPRWRPSHYHYGYRWRRLPSSFVRISIGNLGFFYSDGIFYRPHSHGYVVAQPPIGAVVHSLPASAVTVVFGGYNYYVAYDTYYLWDGRGYRVVANPGFAY